MGKRIAETQLTQDNFNDKADDDQTPEGKDFTKAAPEQLSARKIKALPNRRSGSSTPVTTPKVTTEKFQLPTPSNDQAPENIYLSLRGLNVSVIETLQTLIDQDAFVNLGDKLLSIAATYSTERSRISNNSSTLPTSTKPVSNATQAPAVSAPTFSFGQAGPSSAPAAAKPAPFAGFSFGTAAGAPVSQPKKPDGPPSVPSNGFSFGGKVMGTPEAAKSVSSSTSTPPANGFVFDASKVSKNAEKSAFSFPVPPPVSKSSSAELEVPKAAPINIPTRPSPLRESSHVDSPPSASKSQASNVEVPAEKPKVNPFAAFGGFGSSSAATTKPVPAANGTSTTANPFAAFTVPPPTETPRQNSTIPTFGSAVTSTPTSSQPTFSFGATTSTPKDAAPAFSFGGSSASGPAKAMPQFSFGAQKPATGSATPAPTFSFGTAAPKVPSTSGSVGFSFGASASPFGAAKTSSDTKPAPAAFSFTPPAATASASSSKAPSEGGGEEQPENMEPTLPTSGEGEEDEEVLYEARAAVYVMDPSGPKWVNKGVTLLKVKEAKATGKKRVLARLATTTSGSIVLNFNIPQGWKAEATAKEVSFMGFFGEENKAVKAKVKTAEKATELAEALNAAVPSA